MVNGSMGTEPLVGIAVTGNQLRFEWVEELNGQKLYWKYSGVIRGDKMDLTLTMPMGGKILKMVAIKDR